MATNDHINLQDISNTPELSLCNDGYVRLPEQSLEWLVIHHLISGLDEPRTDTLGERMMQPITGYTEWVSKTVPAITIGWDWQLDFIESRLAYHRISMPRSNLMLTENTSQDLGPEKSETALASWLETISWQAELEEYIHQNYSFG